VILPRLVDSNLDALVSMLGSVVNFASGTSVTALAGREGTVRATHASMLDGVRID